MISLWLWFDHGLVYPHQIIVDHCALTICTRLTPPLTSSKAPVRLVTKVCSCSKDVGSNNGTFVLQILEPSISASVSEANISRTTLEIQTISSHPEYHGMAWRTMRAAHAAAARNPRFLRGESAADVVMALAEEARWQQAISLAQKPLGDGMGRWAANGHSYTGVPKIHGRERSMKWEVVNKVAAESQSVKVQLQLCLEQGQVTHPILMTFSNTPQFSP